MSGGGWRSVPPAGAWGEMEERVLAFWRERDVFARSLERRAGAAPWVFYEGPPTANGRPGSHHVLSRVFKDIFPRFQTMRGRFVDRRGGWDCHGLPVEIEVEKRLGISGKPEIEAYGIAEFNALCRESVLTYLDEWERLTERIGFWIDTDRAYRTMDATYVESVWWSLAELHRLGQLYQSDKVVPYCPRCGTALSSHEVAQGYEDVDDPSVFVRFRLRDEDASLLVWTTTPWTLPSNQAAAVAPDVTYAAVEVGDETLILAEPLVVQVLGEGARPVRTFPASELVGREYEPPFPYIEGAHRVVDAPFVTTGDGTGIVHIAPAFGEDDMATARHHGLDAPNPVGPDGRFTDAVGAFAGRAVKEADPDLIADLDARGLLLRSEVYRHAYPHCWRCGTPLLYYAKPSWYVRTTAVKDRMLEINREIGWHPERVRDGRFGRWLEGNVDWAISRDRYWGTPLPLWRCGGCGTVDAIGSFAELAERATAPLAEPFDPHRPFVDDVALTCPCGGEMRREPEVIDVWYDSGAMPFAQDHHPFATGGDLTGKVPADYICEALDQTRGWFYSLLAESTLLFDGPAYRNVVCLGLILDAEGQKMSKSKGNVIDPWTVLGRQGADAFRWYLLTAQSPWESFRFSLEAVDEAMRRFLLTMWNTHAFLVTYASLPDGWRPGGPPPEPDDLRPIDRWILSRLDGTVDGVTERLEHFDATGAGRLLEELVDDLSNWYVRTGRRRFWGGRGGGDGDAGGRGDAVAAFHTLHECLSTIALLVAPFCPFVAEEMWGTLVAAHDPEAPESVHLADWPRSKGRHSPSLEAAMASSRQAVTVGRGARAEAKLKVRQPLAEAVVACPPAIASEVGSLVDLVAEELNVRRVRFVTDPGELVDVTLKPNYRSLGPRFGKRMPEVAQAVAALAPAETARAIDAGESVTIQVDGAVERLEAADLLREARPTEGYAVGQDARLAVGLATEITPDLRLEGLAREIIHAVQSARRNAGLRVEERIVLHLDGSGLVREAAEAHHAEIAAETLATRTSISHGAPFAGIRHEEHVVDGEPLAIRIDRSP
ncbi:MAG TPA: isoleucine--tRNA ligase [Miltoncostaeaceae bacterium]|nr:isoleucine--tRNA ligase [Miltoncostaeaceae bacterium]